MKIDSNIGKVSGVAGAIDGFLTAIDSGQYKTDFLTRIMDGAEAKFMADTIAIKDRMSHVFEWPDSADGPVPATPLFKITRHGRGEARYMNYTFLPSQKLVPLPSARYGIKPSILAKLKRHTFRFKALVMETQSQVTVAPRDGKALFIPSESSKRGYIMTRRAVDINPGGPNHTGQFSAWWQQWFEQRGQQYINAQVKKKETQNKKNAQKVIRDAAGRFAAGQSKSFGYYSSAKRNAEMWTLAQNKRENL